MVDEAQDSKPEPRCRGQSTREGVTQSHGSRFQDLETGRGGETAGLPGLPAKDNRGAGNQ